jgi:hypothetical protein
VRVVRTGRGVRTSLHHHPLGIGRRVGCYLIHGKGSDNSQGRAGAHAAKGQVHRAAALARACAHGAHPIFFRRIDP